MAYVKVTEGVYVVRAPWAATAAWRLISPLLPAATRAKVSILGADYLSFLLQKVDASSLPPHLLDTDEDKDTATLKVREAKAAADPNSVVDDFEQRALPVPEGVVGTLPD